MQKTSEVTSVSTIRRLLDDGWMEVDIDTTDTMALAYDLHRQLRQSVEDFWEKAQDNMQYLPTTHQVLENNGLQDNHSFKFLGSVSKEELDAVFKRNEVKTSGKILVVPFSDLPGRISMFRMYYIHANTKKSCDIQAPGSDESGIFMLNSVLPGCDMALAVDDPLTAFKVQNHCMLSGSIPFPVIAYTEKTTSWAALLAKKVVFWVTGYGVDVFKVARHAPNAHLSVASVAIDRIRYMRSLSIKQWTGEITGSAIPWTDALAAWLCQISKDEATMAVRELELTAKHQQDVLEAASDTQSRILLKELFHSIANSREVPVNNDTVVERGGGWYFTSHCRRKPKLVSDTMIKMTGTVRLSGAGNYYTGVIERRGTKRRFYALMDMSDKSNKKWLENFCLANDLGCPEIGQGWGGRLFAIARAFAGELANETREGKVGWSKDLISFNLPQRVVSGGRIEVEIGVPVESYPCQHVTGGSLTAEMLRVLLENTKTNAQFWALFACTMMNTAAPFFGIRKKKIGAIGQSNFAYAFANAMDFGTVQVTKRNYNTQPMQHDIPLNMLFEHVKFKEIARWLNDPEEKNILMGVDHLQASQIADDDWVFVRTDDFSKMHNVTAAYDLIPHAVRFVQTDKQKVSSFVPDIFLHRFRQYLCTNFFDEEEVDFTVMDEATKLISLQSPMGTTYGQSFLYGIFFLLQNGQAGMSRTAGPQTVVISADTVTIPKIIVNKVVLDGCTGRIGKSLMEEPSGFSPDYAAWNISTEYWDDTFARFQKEHIF